MRQNIDRRAFLKTSAASLAALAFAPRSFAESFQVPPGDRREPITSSCRIHKLATFVVAEDQSIKALPAYSRRSQIPALD